MIARGDVSVGKRELVTLDSLTTDGRFNREISTFWVNALVANFRPEALGEIVVSRRGASQLVVLDGQHRVEALRELGLDPSRQWIQAIVHEGLSFQDEAFLFKVLNDRKSVTPYQKFKALLAAGDPDVCHINSIVEKLGLRVASGSRDGVLCCVNAIHRIHRISEPKGFVLSETLSVVVNAWGDSSEPLRHDVVEGVARYVVGHPDVESDVLTSRLKQVRGGCSGVKTKASTLRGPTPAMSMSSAIAQVIDTQVMRKYRRSARSVASG